MKRKPQFTKTARKQATAAAMSLLLCAAASLAGVGESAVITLVFPPGARATGLGEAFTGLSDDANATFFNPAGLGQPPLANSWHFFLEKDDYTLTSVAVLPKRAFEMSERVWVGTNKGVLRYNGKTWESHETYVTEGNDDLASIARKFINSDDEGVIGLAVRAIMKQNRIGAKRRALIVPLLQGAALDSTAAQRMSTADELAWNIVSLAPSDRVASTVFGLISLKVDSSRADALSDTIESILGSKDVEFKDLVELKIPFDIAIADSVTALGVDELEQLWAATPSGLWKYDGTSWSRYTILDGLPSNNILCMDLGKYGMVAVGTDAGAAVQSEGVWKSYGMAEGLPDSMVTAVTFGLDSTVFIGTANGLARRADTGWVVFDTADGLLSQSITALFHDSRGKLWIGSPNGVTLYDQLSWKRYKFPDSRVYGFAELGQGRIWIGTNRGTITYRAGRSRIDDNGQTVDQPPEWRVFHSKNALKGDDVRGLAVRGRDVWLVTDKAVNQYDNAEKQVQFFWEPLLPAFGIRDLWHTYFTLIWPTDDWGTIGLLVNYINMGKNEWTDELGRILGAARSWEGVFGLSYGLGIKEGFSIGMNVKYIQSNLAPGIGSGDEGIGRTFAIDAALLKRDLLLRNLDLGFNMMNMGPSIFYISRDQSDPIPFTLRLGLAYTPVQTPIHEFSTVLDFDREFVKNYWDKRPDPFYQALFSSISDDPLIEELQEIQTHLGLEYWYVHFLALRLGFLFDYIGERYELTFGLGLKYGTMNVDWSYIHAPEGFLKGALQAINPEKEGATGARHGQWRISLITRF